MRVQLVLVCAAHSWLGCSPSTPANQAVAPEVTAEVQVAPLERRAVTETLTLYGSVVSGPAGHGTLSVPYETKVARILVRA
ncbi:MAG: hypothetical protein JWN04_1402, partial [Myxococcaceae bacterium]|nr:hypothetical protein [Myxococcaceae bacterium]